MKQQIILNSLLREKISYENIHDRDHMIVMMCPVIADTEMNGLFYPLDEVQESYFQLNNKLAPAGHPRVNGQKVSAYHPLALNLHHIGAYVRNPLMQDKEVICELVIDIEFADKTEKGKEIVKMIKNGDTVWVSTGLTADIYNNTVSFIRFDHVALLIDQEAAGENTRIINSFIVNKEENTMTLSEMITNANADEALGITAKQLSRKSLDQFIENKAKESGQFLINEQQKTNLDYFEKNQESIVNAVKEREQKLTELRNQVIENTGIDEQDVKPMSESAMQKIVNSVSKSNDYSFNAPSTPNVDIDKFLENNQMGVYK